MVMEKSMRTFGLKPLQTKLPVVRLMWKMKVRLTSHLKDSHEYTEILSNEAGGAIPFNTQFFHDDYDDGPGFDDYDGDGVGSANVDASEQDLLAATQGQTRRVRPEFVNYAKRAKRVDVRKLKDNIWRGLDIVVSPAKNEDEDESMVSRNYVLSSKKKRG
jgi:hypothetical protein